MIGKLVLENGNSFKGRLFGYIPDEGVSGEVVFQTGMTGYVETLTDPSYKEQILVFTYPIIGNYGIPKENKGLFKMSKSFESNSVHTSAIVVQEVVDKYLNMLSEVRDDATPETIKKLKEGIERVVPRVTLEEEKRLNVVLNDLPLHL